MRLTKFGEAVRILRMRYDTSLKVLAGAMGISSSHLSGIEYGEKALQDHHIDAVLGYFRPLATPSELSDLKAAAYASRGVVNVESLSGQGRQLVAAFARKLQSEGEPPEELKKWIESRFSEV